MNARRAFVMGLAWVADLLLGDPPNRFHPVAWMGAVIAAAKRRAPRQDPWAQMVYGAGLAIGGAAATAAIGCVVERLLGRLPLAWSIPLQAVLLKMTFSLRGLASAASEVRCALEGGDLDEARRLLGWHLVSRETASLDASQVAAAAIESVAENASDGVIAPLLYYAVGGLPAAMAYRFVNTADAMLGYRDPVHEWLGKASARLDDLVNLVPARLTALLLVGAAAITRERAVGAWRIWRRDHARTASPNAGHPMSAMAGALGVELEKVGYYRLGWGQRKPLAGDIGRAARLVHLATTLGLGLLLVLSLFRYRSRCRAGD
jgi:adenosylcobinamide-phosphate synthase